MEWINFRHLYAFWAVCRHGGFSKAARRIHVSQSTVSEQVAQLEDYLGEELLERSTRAVTVTDRGAALLAYADAIFEKSQEINRIFRDKDSLAGPSSIRVGMVGGISRNFIYGLVTRALDEGHGTHVDLVDGSFDELTELLRRFELDLIFSLDRPHQKDLATVSHVRVDSSPLCLAGTPELVASITAPRADPLPTELYMFRHPFEGPPLQEVIASGLELDLDVPVMTDDISLLRFMANSGRGLAVVPEIGIKEDLASGRVRRIRLHDAPRIEIYGIFLTKGVRRSLIDRFLDVRPE